jgi:hypothetical protein
LPRKEYTTEQVIGLLREAEILIEIGADTTTPSGHTRHSALGHRGTGTSSAAHGKPTGFLSP